MRHGKLSSFHNRFFGSRVYHSIFNKLKFSLFLPGTNAIYKYITAFKSKKNFLFIYSLTIERSPNGGILPAFA
jgi:hypothetical protein